MELGESKEEEDVMGIPVFAYSILTPLGTDHPGIKTFEVFAVVQANLYVTLLAVEAIWVAVKDVIVG